MKKMFKLMLGMLVGCFSIISLAGCGGDIAPIDNEPETPVVGESQILVAYFSWSGNTQELANMVSESTGGELFRIVPEIAYPANYEECASRARNELDSETRPTLSSHIEEEVMEEYDVIFIGYPIWWYDLPMSVWTFLEEYDLSGKTIVPFFSHNGSSSGASSRTTISELCPDSTVLSDYFSINGRNVSGASNSVTEWVQKLGYAKSE